jgi:signal transduction histidine kinase
LEAARREAIGWVLAGLMHESRNALQQIGSCAEMLAIELANRSDLLDLVQGVEEAQARLVEMLDDLRTYSAPLEPAYRPVDLAALWRHVWRNLLLEDRWPRAQLSEQAVPADTRCQADPVLIIQALAALFRHALDAAGPAPRLEIACHEITFSDSSGTAPTVPSGTSATAPGGTAAPPADQPALALSITDTARQLTLAEQQQLFEPFFCRRAGGAGLDMAIARRLVELHGGTLVARCTAPGAELILTVPRRSAKKS